MPYFYIMTDYMKTRTLITATFLLMMSAMSIKAEIVKIDTDNTSLVFKADKGKKLKHLYYGDKLPASDLKGLASAVGSGRSQYPDYGMITVPETAIAMVHSDGNMTLDLVVDRVERKTIDGKETTSLVLKDSFYPVEVKLNYKSFPEQDMLEVWSEITNNESGNVKLTRYASAHLPIRQGDVWLSHLHGAWGNETKVEHEPLLHGMKVIKNRNGTRNSHLAHSEVMFSLDGKPNERSGRTIGAALCYGGNYRLKIDTDETNSHSFIAGINEDDSPYNLKSGETFITPELAMTFSKKGLGGASRNFHKWARKHKLQHGDKERKVLLNSWEGVYFDINEKGMASMMKDIADMGGELFVMDDGWFGVKYPRNNAESSLGDWMVDTRKLPHGIKGLLKEADKNKIKFGIWIEPENTNVKSELFEAHPEYVIKPENRTPKYGRGGGQMVLDLANPAVQDLVFSVVDTLMTKYPGIDYIKWDANMDLTNHGSQYQTTDNQSHLFIDYHKGLRKVLERIRAKYPDLTMQACAGGGGRANYGYLPYFDEFWVSDNTDALQRIFIQWGTSYFYPSIAMASHISAAPNHQTFRTIPLKFRTDVAMSGRLGIEIQPANMTTEEKNQTRKAVEDYKAIRPIVQFGDLYRLASPYDEKGVASLMYVDESKDNAVFYWYKTKSFRNEILPRITFDGLDPDKVYTVTELNRIDTKPLSFEGKSYSGAFLMSSGLEIPVSHELPKEKKTDWSSRVLKLSAK